MPDDLDAFLDDVAATAAPPSDDPMTLEDVQRTLVPLAATLRATVADIALIPVARATPAQRAQLATLREELDRARRDLSTWVDAIDIGFRIAAVDLGATEILLEDGAVKVEPPRGEWVVNVPMLRQELDELRKHGIISKEEVDSIFKTTVTEKADNTRLNYFAKSRGAEIAEAIERARVWKPGDPAAAKVRYMRKAR